MNIIRHTPTLDSVIMPMVRAMVDADLSWSDRALISRAILACNSHWESMERERHEIEQAGCQQQCSVPTVLAPLKDE